MKDVKQIESKIGRKVNYVFEDGSKYIVHAADSLDEYDPWYEYDPSNGNYRLMNYMKDSKKLVEVSMKTPIYNGFEASHSGWTAEDYLAHSAKGTHWEKKDHKYVKKEGKRYFYSGPKYDFTKMTVPDDVISDEGVDIVVKKLNNEENPLKKMFNESDQQHRTNNAFENFAQSFKDALSKPVEAISTAIKVKKGLDIVQGVWNGLVNSMPSFQTMTRKLFK